MQSLVQIGTVVSEKILFDFLYVHNLGPRSRYDIDLQYSLSGKIYNILCLIIIFLLGHDFRIFAKVADFKKKKFRVQKYTVSNFFICQYIGIELPA